MPDVRTPAPQRPAARPAHRPAQHQPAPAGGRPRRPTGATRIAVSGPRRLRLRLAAGLAAAVLAASAVAHSALTWGEGQVTRVDAFTGLGNRPAAAARGATTYLVIGSDSREGLPAADLRRLGVGSTATAGGRRSDTMLLVHVSPRRGAVTVVSLPRDSYVDIPGHGNGKLNASYSLGGPPLTVAAVEQATQLRVDHYVEVDFAGFAAMVDAVGGVTVCTPQPISDAKAHLELPAGRHRLDGVASLGYVRARDFDQRADVGRMERQQDFLAEMLREATSKGVLLNPFALTRFVDAALGSLQVDAGLERGDLLALITSLRGLRPADVTFLTVPIADAAFRPGGQGAVARWDDAAARDLFQTLRADRPVQRPDSRRVAPAQAAPPTVPPRDVRVRVLNGAGVRGLGARAAEDLRRAGFDVVGPPGNAETRGATRTVVRYTPEHSAALPTLRAALPAASFEPVGEPGDGLTVVVGSSYDGLAALPGPTATGATTTGTTATGTPRPARAGSTAATAPPVRIKTAAQNPCA